MLVRIPPKYSVSEIMGYLKGKSSLMIFEEYANLKYKYGNRHFGAGGILPVWYNSTQIPYEQLKEPKQFDYVCDGGREINFSLPSFYRHKKFLENFLRCSQKRIIIWKKILFAETNCWGDANGYDNRTASGWKMGRIGAICSGVV